MRKRCLFDPNHLIDEFGMTKHLLNCQSKLKKDWRKCKFSDQHWHLYNQIDVHEKYQCALNPLCIKDPKKFREARQEYMKKKNGKSQENNIPKFKNQDFGKDNHFISFSKQIKSAINFGEISIIESDENLKTKINGHSQLKIIEDNQAIELHNILDLSHTVCQKIKSMSIDQANTSNQNILNISNQKQEIFEKGIRKIQKQLWIEPNFQEFQKKFKQRWLSKKQNKIQNHQNVEQNKQEHFEQEIKLQISEFQGNKYYFD